MYLYFRQGVELDDFDGDKAEDREDSCSQKKQEQQNLQNKCSPASPLPRADLLEHSPAPVDPSGDHHCGQGGDQGRPDPKVVHPVLEREATTSGEGGNEVRGGRS